MRVVPAESLNRQVGEADGDPNDHRSNSRHDHEGDGSDLDDAARSHKRARR